LTAGGQHRFGNEQSVERERDHFCNMLRQIPRDHPDLRFDDAMVMMVVVVVVVVMMMMMMMVTTTKMMTATAVITTHATQ